MIDGLKKYIDTAYTQYHAVKNASELLLENGFVQLFEGSAYNLKKGGKYFVVRNGSSLIAFTVGEGEYSYKIVASHTDSPALKIKLNGETAVANCKKLEVETYGGMLMYSWFDRPLKVAGRVIVNKDGSVYSKLVEEDTTVIIPSVAVHLNRQVNTSFAPNAQTDMQALCGLATEEKYISSVLQKNLEEGEEVVDYDLFVTSATEGFLNGTNGELFSSPRIDDLASVYSSLQALINAKPCGVNVCCLYDNEEVGSRSAQGAGGKFLIETLERINFALGYSKEDFIMATTNSFMVSCDGAHATHPNHPELSSPNHKIEMGKGVVVKHHANLNYTTDGFSSALIKTVFKNANVPCQDFYMRSDMPCGGTLGAISSSQYSVKSVDIGVAQLSMHSAVETVAVKDCQNLLDGLLEFYQSIFKTNANGSVEVIKP